jgi:regulator of nucleoside diphosphate kinase
MQTGNVPPAGGAEANGLDDTIVLTDRDLARLSELAEELRMRASRASRTADLVRNLDMLDRELGRARIVSPDDLSADTVAVGSRVRVKDLDSGELTEYVLVWPDQTDGSGREVSVLAPVGMALLGYRAGQVVEWPVPAGVRRFRIDDVRHRPEGVAEDAS